MLQHGDGSECARVVLDMEAEECIFWDDSTSTFELALTTPCGACDARWSLLLHLLYDTRVADSESRR